MKRQAEETVEELEKSAKTEEKENVPAKETQIVEEKP